MFAAMRPMKKLQNHLTLPSRENNTKDRYNDGVEGHPASSTFRYTRQKRLHLHPLKKGLKMI